MVSWVLLNLSQCTVQTGYDVVYGVYEEDNSTTVKVRELMLTIGNLSELSHTSNYVSHVML